MGSGSGNSASEHTFTEAILESISDGVFTVDMEWRISSFNRAAEEITGIGRNEALGRLCSDVFRSSMCGPECALKKTLKTGRPVIGTSAYIDDSTGGRVPISVSTAVLRDNEGRVVGGAETFRDMSELETLRRQLDKSHHVAGMSSRSALMRRLFEVLPAISSSPSNVLVEGETGTGKELLARTIHNLSGRNDRPFVAVNCGALPDALLESELFGYKAGAFTGAGKDKPGRFALAKGGTIFLDEIGEISPALQVRLLRVLQERTYEPLGSIRSEEADVRVIVATNKDLAEQVEKGLFRQDLFYRINVVRIELPPLRKRKEDIPLLVEQFITRFNHLQQKSVTGIAPEAVSLLMAHHWPGNIRELANIIERSFILCHSGEIGISCLPSEFTSHYTKTTEQTDLDSAHAALDEQAILTALEHNGFNRLAASRDLGIHKTTLYRRMKKLGIELPDQDGRSKKSG